MAQTTPAKLPHTMQYALKEVVDITREIGDLSWSILNKLQRPLEDTPDHLRCLVEETWTLFSTINDKVRMVQEILKQKLPHGSSVSDNQERHVQNMHPSTRHQTGDLFKHVLQKSTTPRTTSNVAIGDTNDLLKHVIRADNVDYTFLDDAMSKADIKYNDEYTSSYGNDFDLGAFSAFSAAGIATSFMNQDMQRQLLTKTKQLVANVYECEHLVSWMAELLRKSDKHIGDLTDRPFKLLSKEVIDSIPRGCQHLNMMKIASGIITNDDLHLLDFSKVLLDINEEVKRAQRSHLPVRGTGPDTVLCLDTSASMYGDKFMKMINVGNQIIDGIEELAFSEALLGNVAVTTFGTESCVTCHLTSDYSQVRNVLGSLVAEGPSPLYHGLAMSIAACIGNYAEVTVNDVRLMTRVIVITDGMFSAEDAKDEHYEFDPKNDVMIPSAANVMKMNGIVCYCVQVGTYADSQLLQTLTLTTKGKIFPDDQVNELIRLPTHLFAATSLLRQVPELMDGGRDMRENEGPTLHALMDLESSYRNAIGTRFSKTEKKTIIALTMNISKLPLTRVNEQQEYNVFELELDLLPVGTRVRRGPDWDPGDNKDSNGPGTVVYHCHKGIVAVLWDCCIKPLPYCCYDPCQVLCTDSDERAVRDDGWVQVGCKVVRGPRWTHGDDDGGPGSCGVVCLCSRTGTVTVRWPSRIIRKYIYGDEVVLLDTLEGQAHAMSYDNDINTREFEPGKKQNIEGYRELRETANSNLKLLKQSASADLIKKDRTEDVQSKLEPNSSIPDVQVDTEKERYCPFLWSFQKEDEVEWTPFDACNNVKLEYEWSKQRKTSMVYANNKRYRVAFGKLTMTSIGGNDEEKQLRFHVKRERKPELDVEDAVD